MDKDGETLVRLDSRKTFRFVVWHEAYPRLAGREGVVIQVHCLSQGGQITAIGDITFERVRVLEDGRIDEGYEGYVRRKAFHSAESKVVWTRMGCSDKPSPREYRLVLRSRDQEGVRMMKTYGRALWAALRLS